MTVLCEMARTYHTDKVGWYTPFYDLLLSPRRLEIKRMLEVGIGTKETMKHVDGYLPGASLFMWRDYFPNAEIWGVDSDRRALTEFESIRSVHSDSTDPELVSKLPRSFDLVVDDGSHNAEIQFKTFLNLWPLVRDGGLYIIEDAESWRDLSELLDGFRPTVVLTPHSGTSGKLMLIRK